MLRTLKISAICLGFPLSYNSTVKTLRNLQVLIKMHKRFHNCWKVTAQSNLQHNQIIEGATVSQQFLMLTFQFLKLRLS